MIVKVEEDDINKKIYFLDNYKDNNNLKEINESNTELYINNKKENVFKKYFVPGKEGEYQIKLKFNKIINDCSYLFAECNKIIIVNFNSFNTTNANNMKYMFYNCEKLNIINLLSFNTTKVKNMEYMFYNCKILNDLDLSSFEIKNDNNMSYMFYNCENLKNLSLFSNDNAKIDNMKME